MDEKVWFVAVLADEASMTELCESFGISRKTGYKWLLRYRAHGLEGLHELPRAPHRVAWAISERAAAAILKLRRAHPSWGPKKLRAKLGQRGAEQEWPAPSTIGELLRCCQIKSVTYVSGRSEEGSHLSRRVLRWRPGRDGTRAVSQHPVTIERRPLRDPS